METNTSPDEAPVEALRVEQVLLRSIELLEQQNFLLADIRNLLIEMSTQSQLDSYKQKFRVDPLPKSFKNGPSDPMGPVTFGNTHRRPRSVLVGQETQIGGQRGPQ